MLGEVVVNFEALFLTRLWNQNHAEIFTIFQCWIEFFHISHFGGCFCSLCHSRNIAYESKWVSCGFHSLSSICFFPFRSNGWTTSQKETKRRYQPKTCSFFKRRCTWKPDATYFFRAGKFFLREMGLGCFVSSRSSRIFSQSLQRFSSTANWTSSWFGLFRKTWHQWSIQVPWVDFRHFQFWPLGCKFFGKPPCVFSNLPKGFLFLATNMRQGTRCTIRFLGKRTKHAGCLSNFSAMWTSRHHTTEPCKPCCCLTNSSAPSITSILKHGAK